MDASSVRNVGVVAYNAAIPACAVVGSTLDNLKYALSWSVLAKATHLVISPWNIISCVPGETAFALSKGMAFLMYRNMLSYSAFCASYLLFGNADGCNACDSGTSPKASVATWKLLAFIM